MKRWKKIVLFSVLCLLVVAVGGVDANAAGIFAELKGRTAFFAKQLRLIAYAISGFGVIMFTFLAISGKINFKHLGYIFISLFMLSAMGAVIDYFSGSHAQLESNFGDTYTEAVCNSSLCH